MRSIFIALSLFTINSWAGLQVQHCTNVENTIRLCIDLTRQLGKLDINAEKVFVKFSGETKLTSEFILKDSSRSGKVEVFMENATLQIADETLLHLDCEAPNPGHCK